MAKLIPYDVTDVEEGGGGGSEIAKPGVYVGRIAFGEKRDVKTDGSPANDLRIALDVGERYEWLWTYVGLGESSDWKLKEFISAIKLPDKGKINLEKLVKDKTLIRVKVNPDTFEGRPTARAGRLMKALPEDTEPGPVGQTADETEPLPEDDTEPEAETTTGDDGATREDANDPEVGSYDDWSDEDVEAEVEERSLTVAGGRGSKRAKQIKALREDDAEAAGGAGDDGDGGGDDAETTSDDDKPEDEYDDFSQEELEAEVNDRQLEVKKPRGSNAEERYMKAMIAALRKDDAENPFEG